MPGAGCARGLAAVAVPAGDTSHGSGILASVWAGDCPLACSFGHLEGGGDPGEGLVEVVGRFLLWCKFQLRQYDFDTP